jgi:HK97 family phage major capsid protein
MTLGNQAIWFPPNSTIQNAPTGGYLLGRPVVPLENCQTVGDQGDIQFVNPKGYYAAKKGLAPEYAESMHLFFDYGLKAFRWTFRLGGQPYLSAAISPAKGSSTRAHVVVLDARA